MRIKDLSKIERPREKLIKHGVNKLTDAELLAIVLGSGTRGENVIELSKKVLKTINRDKLDQINLKDLATIRGMGLIKACQIVACIELGKRILKGKKAVFVMSPKEIFRELKDIRNNKKEYFVIFYLDVRNQIIRKEIISIGTLNASIVHPREVFEPAVRNLAAQIILSHNHPSGDPQPSSEDLELTKKLVESGRLLGIEIIDHVVVCEDEYFSMKENKMI